MQMKASKQSRQLLLCCIAGLALLASLAVMSEAAKTRDPFYIIAHMSNSQSSLVWAVRQGANAIEIDVQFDQQGRPRIFEHGGTCDCSCNHPAAYHICSLALQNKCSGPSASSDPAKYLARLARLPVALFFIDAKVNPGWGSAKLQSCGTNLVKLVEKNLLARGYRGKVIISAASMKSNAFVESASKAAAKAVYASRYFFTFDQEENNYSGVVAKLAKFTRNRVYGTGAGSCSTKSAAYSPAIKQAVKGVSSRQVGMSYVYTVDMESVMKTYIDLGLQGIMTNAPGLLRKVAKSKGLQIAVPGDRIPIAK